MLKRKHQGDSDTFILAEVFAKISGKQHYLWRTVDRDGDVVYAYLQAKQDVATAKRFFGLETIPFKVRTSWIADTKRQPYPLP